MKIDANIGGGIDGTVGGNIRGVVEQVRAAGDCRLDGVWTTETSRSPFLPLMLAAEHAPSLKVGTSVAVAFARSPMTLAAEANDLQAFSRGRFMLGIGSQVKAHVERRFNMPWSQPARRMAEYIAALRAIWESWQQGTPLRFGGDFYQFSLMTPMFTPEPHRFGPPPILLAAVGPQMTSVAATAADGLIVHGFTTEQYLREVTLPPVRTALERASKDRAGFTVSYPGLVATGESEQELVRAIGAVRQQIAFYGATPAYAPVLELHGWRDLHDELHRLSLLGEWTAMTTLIDADVLDAFAIVGTPEEAGSMIVRRYGELVDRFTLYTPYELGWRARARLVAAASTMTSVGRR